LYFLDRKKITFKLRITKKEKLTKKKTNRHHGSHNNSEQITAAT